MSERSKTALATPIAAFGRHLSKQSADTRRTTASDTKTGNFMPTQLSETSRLDGTDPFVTTFLPHIAVPLFIPFSFPFSICGDCTARAHTLQLFPTAGSGSRLSLLLPLYKELDAKGHKLRAEQKTRAAALLKIAPHRFARGEWVWGQNVRGTARSCVDLLTDKGGGGGKREQKEKERKKLWGCEGRWYSQQSFLVCATEALEIPLG